MSDSGLSTCDSVPGRCAGVSSAGRPGPISGSGIGFRHCSWISVNIKYFTISCICAQKQYVNFRSQKWSYTNYVASANRQKRGPLAELRGCTGTCTCTCSWWSKNHLLNTLHSSRLSSESLKFMISFQSIFSKFLFVVLKWQRTLLRRLQKFTSTRYCHVVQYNILRCTS